MTNKMLDPIYTYKVYYLKTFLGYEYAMSEEEARIKAFAYKGCASEYAGISVNDVRAELA